MTQDELKVWIKYVQNKYIIEDTTRQWKEHDLDGDALLWESYKKRTYGYLDSKLQYFIDFVAIYGR